MDVHDPLIEKTVRELVKKHKCHTVLLYGSRARGDATEASDYDMMGVTKSGKKLRLARKVDGRYLDLFVFQEKELKTPNETHLYMSGAKVLHDAKGFGAAFLRKLALIAKKKFTPLPPDELEMRRVWLHKMFERTLIGDLEGLYRRSWLHEALLYEYFNIRKKRYSGSKQSFAWLKKHDRSTHTLFEKVLSKPKDKAALKALVVRVSGRKSG